VWKVAAWQEIAEDREGIKNKSTQMQQLNLNSVLKDIRRKSSIYRNSSILSVRLPYPTPSSIKFYNRCKARVMEQHSSPMEKP
jgi:uncharacterized lipoprotein YddW (UPF0748 family)